MNPVELLAVSRALFELRALRIRWQRRALARAIVRKELQHASR